MKINIPRILMAALVITTTLAGCGGGGSPSPNTDSGNADSTGLLDSGGSDSSNSGDSNTGSSGTTTGGFTPGNGVYSHDVGTHDVVYWSSHKKEFLTERIGRLVAVNTDGERVLFEQNNVPPRHVSIIPSPTGRYVALVGEFESTEKKELFVFDTQNPGKITKVNGELLQRDSVHNVSWSTDGDMLAYLDRSPGGDPNLYVVSADGSSRVLVASADGAFGVQYPIWSPTENEQIAYKINSSIYVANIVPSSGTLRFGRSTVWTSSAFGTTDLRWSPTGSRIAVKSADNLNGSFILTSDGNGDVRPADPPGPVSKRIGEYRWKPGVSDILAFYADLDERYVFQPYLASASGAWIMSLDQSSYPEFADVEGIEWSFSGQYAAVIGDLEIDGKDELFLLSGSGSARARLGLVLHADQDVREIYWSPAAETIVYRSKLSSRYFCHIGNADGSGYVDLDRCDDSINALSKANSARTAVWWSPDGSRFVTYDNEIRDNITLRLASDPSVTIKLASDDRTLINRRDIDDIAFLKRQ